MWKTLMVVVLLPAIAGNATGADIFKCQRPDGTVYFSDKPAQQLDDCRMERIETPPPSSTLPETALPAAPPVAEEPKLPAVGKSFVAFKSEASQLVEQFEVMRRRYFRASYQIDKQSARRELTAIRARKDALLQEVDEATLSRSEKAEISDLLTGITE